jgi:hypothetical protein
MSAESYTVRYRGHVIRRSEDTFHITVASGATQSISICDERYHIDRVRVESGNAWIDDTQVIKEGSALCYTIKYAGYTITRSPGSQNILVEGHGHHSPMQWNAPAALSSLGNESVIMRNGHVRVGRVCVIFDGTLEAHGLDMTESEARQMEARTQPAAQAIPAPVSQPRGMAPTTHASDYTRHDSPPKLFEVIGPCGTVARYQDYFLYNGPGDENHRVGLNVTTSGYGFMFKNGDVWLEGKQVITRGASGITWLVHDRRSAARVLLLFQQEFSCSRGRTRHRPSG